jgi:hypothetical protein
MNNTEAKQTLRVLHVEDALFLHVKDNDRTNVEPTVGEVAVNVLTHKRLR